MYPTAGGELLNFDQARRTIHIWLNKQEKQYALEILERIASCHQDHNYNLFIVAGAGLAVLIAWLFEMRGPIVLLPIVICVPLSALIGKLHDDSYRIPAERELKRYVKEVPNGEELEQRVRAALRV